MQNICNGVIWPYNSVGGSIVNAKYCKWIAAVFLAMSCLLLLVLLWMGAVSQNVFFSLIPYGISILTFALAWRALCRAQPRWCAADTVLGLLFLLSFLAMAVHVIVGGIVNGFEDAFSNLSMYYVIPLSAIAFVWLVVRVRPGKGAPLADKVLYALPVAAMVAMAVHCGILCIKELSRNKLASSMPWWVLPVLVALLYLAAALVLLAVYGVYRLIQRRKNRE